MPVNSGFLSGAEVLNCQFDRRQLSSEAENALVLAEYARKPKSNPMIRVLIALLSIAAGVAIGVLWFVFDRALEPFFCPVDARFYFNLRWRVRKG